MTWTSLRKPSGNSGRIGRSIRRRHQGLVLGRAALALEEAAGDLARGEGLLLVVHGQREEVLAGPHRARADHGAEHDGVAEPRHDRAVGLAGDLAGLQRQELAAPGDVLAVVVVEHASFLLGTPAGLRCPNARRSGRARSPGPAVCRNRTGRPAATRWDARREHRSARSGQGSASRAAWMGLVPPRVQRGEEATTRQGIHVAGNAVAVPVGTQVSAVKPQRARVRERVWTRTRPKRHMPHAGADYQGECGGRSPAGERRRRRSAAGGCTAKRRTPAGAPGSGAGASQAGARCGGGGRARDASSGLLGSAMARTPGSWRPAAAR